MKIVQVSEIIPYSRNARDHSDAQISQISQSIRTFGFTNPLLVDALGNLIAGHGRLAAARQLGMAELPAIVLDGLTAAEQQALRIADNKLALNASWDDALLRTELMDLREGGFDLALTGFGEDELDALFDEPLDDIFEGNGAGSLAAQFGIPPFSVLNARDGWWQDRKRAWLALGIQSELGRGDQAAISGSPMPLDRANATPGGALMPAADYSKRQRGDGRGRALG